MTRDTPGLPTNPFDQAVEAVARGGCIVYPTETFYALGAAANNAHALERICAIKGRPGSKPLPVIIGDMAQLALILDENARTRWPGFTCAAELMARFWPGPLSIVVPARETLPARLSDAQGAVAVRLTPHPVAKKLCLAAKIPLAATSANVSGEAPVNDPAGLSRAVRRAADAVLAGEPRPVGGLASTVVAPMADRGIVVHRAGALPIETLVQGGFRLVREP